jgi:hypothetical protein
VVSVTQATLFGGGSAVFSADGIYRYRLERRGLLANDRVCLFIMCNPSTADDVKNDPTLSRCCNYARNWGYGRLIVCNLFGQRSTDPAALCDAAEHGGDPRRRRNRPGSA